MTLGSLDRETQEEDLKLDFVQLFRNMSMQGDSANISSNYTFVDYLSVIKSIYQNIINYEIPQIDEIMNNYLPGYTFCLVALPFNNGFFVEEFMDEQSRKKFFDNAEFMRMLLVNDEGLTMGVNDRTAPYFNILPDEIKKDVKEGGCTFALDYPKDENPQKWFMSNVELALSNLKDLIKNNHLDGNGVN